LTESWVNNKITQQINDGKLNMSKIENEMIASFLKFNRSFYDPNHQYFPDNSVRMVLGMPVSQMKCCDLLVKHKNREIWDLAEAKSQKSKSEAQSQIESTMDFIHVQNPNMLPSTGKIEIDELIIGHQVK
jgi:hypothetical protein